MEELGRKEVSFIQNRHNIIDDPAELVTIKTYGKGLYNVDQDQQAIG